MAVNLWLLTLLKKFHGGDLLSILQHSSTPEARFPVLTAQIVIHNKEMLNSQTCQSTNFKPWPDGLAS